MVDLTSLASQSLPLAGVALGAWLTARIQRRAADETRQQERAAARESAFTEFLAAYERLRRLILSPAVDVRVSPPPAGRRFGTPVIDGATAQWDCLEAANARIQLMAGGSAVDEAARDAIGNLFDVARARATFGPGQVPQAVIDGSRDVVQHFVECARHDVELWENARQGANRRHRVVTLPGQRRGSASLASSQRR